MKGDCLERMKEIPDGSVDLVLTDPPYGTTQCKWDSIIPLDEMWKHLMRIIKPGGAIVMTACQPFTTSLISSNLKMFKYTLVWRKSRCPNFAQAPYRFLTEHEDIIVFSSAGTAKNAKNRMTYNPQGTIKCYKICKGKGSSDHRPRKRQKDYAQEVTGYPKSILEFKSSPAKKHPTQKPVELMEYLISTYTNSEDLVLDFTAGSFTTGVAAVRLDRKFIGIELDEGYFELGKQRVLDELAAMENLND
jgi:site-specific DNA-methyltransferase (adenine-specific)